MPPPANLQQRLRNLLEPASTALPSGPIPEPFKGLFDDPMLADYFAIDDFLAGRNQNRNLLRTVIDQLEADVVHELLQQGLVLPQDRFAARDAIKAHLATRPTPTSPPYRSHVLSRVLRRLEPHQNVPRTPALIGFASPDQFLAVIASKAHFKDVFVNPLHGEYAHRIQWNLIARANILSFPTDEVYAGVAQYKGFTSAFRSKCLQEPRRSGDPGSLWEFLFDRTGKRTNADTAKYFVPNDEPFDLRSPFSVTMNLSRSDVGLLINGVDPHREIPALARIIEEKKSRREIWQSLYSTKSDRDTDLAALGIGYFDRRTLKKNNRMPTLLYLTERFYVPRTQRPSNDPNVKAPNLRASVVQAFQGLTPKQKQWLVAQATKPALDPNATPP